MTKLLHGAPDTALDRVGEMLELYERNFPGSRTDYYRRNDVSIRLRIIDPIFSKMDLSDRHDHVEDFMTEYLSPNVAQDVTLLVLLSPQETDELINLDYENPIPSVL